MNHLKYRILLRVHESSAEKPARRRDFYKCTGKVNQCHRCIDELIERKYLFETVGTDKLTITSVGVDVLEAEQERLRLFWWDFFRYAVTTIIAIAALVISIISLFVR